MQPPSDESSRPGDVVTGPFLGMCPEKESEKSPLSAVFSQGHESHHQGGILMTNQNQIPPKGPTSKYCLPGDQDVNRQIRQGKWDTNIQAPAAHN